jgi:hypothetical protein
MFNTTRISGALGGRKSSPPLVQEPILEHVGVRRSGGRHHSRRSPVQRCRHRQPLNPCFQRHGSVEEVSVTIGMRTAANWCTHWHNNDDGEHGAAPSLSPSLKFMYLVFGSLLVHEGVRDAPPLAGGLCWCGGRGHTEKGLHAQKRWIASAIPSLASKFSGSERH